MITIVAISSLFVLLAVLLIGCCFEVGSAREIPVLFGLFAVLCFGLLAYLWAPYTGSDLSRYFVELSLLQHYGMSYFPHALYASTPLTNIFMYLVALTGNYHLFPMISASLATAILVFIWIAQLRMVVQPSRAFFLTMACSLGVNGILSVLIGGRQHLALAFMLLAVWYDTSAYRKKIPVMFCLYCVPLLIHTGVIPIYIARILVTINRCGKSIFPLVVISACGALFSGPLLNVMVDHGVGGAFVREIAEKFIAYQTEVGIWDWRIFALNMAVCFTSTLLCMRTLILGFDSKYSRVLLAVLVMASFYSTNYHLMSRVMAFALYGFLPIISVTLSVRRKDKFTWYASSTLLVLIVLEIAYQAVSVVNQWHLLWL